MSGPSTLLTEAHAAIAKSATLHASEQRYGMFVVGLRLVAQHFSSTNQMHPTIIGAINRLDTADIKYATASRQLSAIKKQHDKNVSNVSCLTSNALRTATILRNAPDKTRREAAVANANALADALIATDVMRSSASALKAAQTAYDIAFSQALTCAEICASELAKLPA